MRVALFCHSLLSDWNHGNAHFLRGVVTELAMRGHEVVAFEPRNAWSVQNLLMEQGEQALDLTRAAFPHVRPIRYDPERLDVDEAIEGSSLVLVHEWNDASLVRRIGEHRKRRAGYLLFFHDTHHRSVTDPRHMSGIDLSGFDGVLAFGEAVREVYLARGWSRRVWTWHEAADIRTFRPLRPAALDPDVERSLRDVVWIGNWGDEERTRELSTFLLDPVARLGMSATVHGVRYPAEALRTLARSGVAYRGWIPNHQVPLAFSRHRFTVHVPRRAYASQLPGIPTIRPFEALACGMPMVSAPWSDVEGLFEVGKDFLVARDTGEMCRHMRAITHDPALRRALSQHGRAKILAAHTCAHRVDELLGICRSLGLEAVKGAA